MHLETGKQCLLLVVGLQSEHQELRDSPYKLHTVPGSVSHPNLDDGYLRDEYLPRPVVPPHGSINSEVERNELMKKQDWSSYLYWCNVGDVEFIYVIDVNTGCLDSITIL